MSYTPDPSPVPGGPASSRGRSIGRRVLAAPLPLALAVALLSGCAAGATPADPVTGTSPAATADASPSASPSATPSPSASPRTPAPGEVTTPSSPPAPGEVTTVEAQDPTPSPTETPVRMINPPSGAFLALDTLSVAAAGAGTAYDRDAQYGDWADLDGDSCDTRQEILRRDLTDVVSSDGCTVASGTLADPYTGSVIDFVRGVATSSAVQIDHVVALAAGHRTGASELSQAERVAFANDPLNLLAVDGPTNQEKSDKDAAEWLPPHEAYRCDYVARQIAVKQKYGLWVTAPEKDAMATVLSSCPGQELPAAEAVPAAPVEPVPAPAPVEQAPVAPAPVAPAPVAPAPVEQAPVAPAPATDVHYKNCTAAREAGAAPLHRGEPGYREAMDGDSDGVACEG